MDNDYWRKFFIRDEVVSSAHPQVQVGRTVNRVPIDDSRWQFTLAEIERLLELQPSDRLLDLCAGNGLIAIPFSEKCESVTAVDISPQLIAQINTRGRQNLQAMVGNALELELPRESFSKVVMYFAMQHFDERESLMILQTVLGLLKPGGIFLVGDIPDRARLWTFFNTPERQEAYFQSLVEQKSILGNWFDREFLLRAARHARYAECQVLDQDPQLINAHYRFDLWLRK
jgi:ubiquinone/menaquinone biosynthesis C-methylase UbiE